MRTICGQNFSFIAPFLAQKPPKLGPIGSGTQKNQGYLRSKVENGKYPEVKLCGFINYGWMVLLRTMWEFVLTLWGGLRGIFGPIFNYIRIMWFMWDLGLVSLDSPKNVVSGKILIFGNILFFPGVNWAQKWTKSVNFGCVPFPLKDICFKDSSYSVIGSSYSTSVPNLSIIGAYLGEKGLKNPPKWVISWMLHCHETVWNFITWEPQML